MDRIDTMRPIYDSFSSSSTIQAEFDQISLNQQNGSPQSSKVGDKTDAASRRFPEEEDEAILKETNDRFVLFPIKYNEVR